MPPIGDNQKTKKRSVVKDSKGNAVKTGTGGVATSNDYSKSAPKKSAKPVARKTTKKTASKSTPAKKPTPAKKSTTTKKAASTTLSRGPSSRPNNRKKTKTSGGPSSRPNNKPSTASPRTSKRPSTGSGGRTSNPTKRFVNSPREEAITGVGAGITAAVKNLFGRKGSSNPGAAAREERAKKRRNKARDRSRGK